MLKKKKNKKSQKKAKEKKNEDAQEIKRKNQKKKKKKVRGNVLSRRKKKKKKKATNWTSPCALAHGHFRHLPIKFLSLSFLSILERKHFSRPGRKHLGPTNFFPSPPSNQTPTKKVFIPISSLNKHTLKPTIYIDAQSKVQKIGCDSIHFISPHMIISS